MPDDDLDPGASTQMFQAFMERSDEQSAAGSRWTLVALAAVAALVIVSVLVWLVLGR